MASKPHQRTRKPLQFSLRALLVVTTLVAVCLAFVPFRAIVDHLRYTPEQRHFRASLEAFERAVEKQRALRAADDSEVTP